MIETRVLAEPMTRHSPTSVVDPAVLRDAMARFPSGVTIVVTRDPESRAWGFTASSFASLSMDPPLSLVCLSKSAQCFPAFAASPRFAIHIIGSEHAAVAYRFATKGADKFWGIEFAGDGTDGLPVLIGAVARLSCATYATYDGGDHVILVGRVQDAQLGANHPAVYFNRRFWSVCDDTSTARTEWR